MPQSASMDSDSDSDGSHVSATPPRDPISPPRPPQSRKPPPQPQSWTPLPEPPSRTPPPRPTVLSPNDRLTKRTRPSSRSKIASKSKVPSPKPKPKPSQQPDLPPLPSLPSDLPFQIRRTTDQSRSVLADRSTETLRAGFFSTNRASFSKFQISSLNFKQEDDSPEIATGCSDPTKVPSRRLPNLIGATVPLPAVKLQKRSSEGNFVRLNLNGNNRKFIRKGKRYSSSTSKSRFYRRSKKRVKSEAKTENICEEDSLVVEINQQPQKENKIEDNITEEVVSLIQEEASDENLVNLLKVMYGHDSFREGQMEAIKMVLEGNSTMLVLPTGAGKTLCYQIPAVVLPGITLVVSPLVALMIDQLKQLPPFIPGGILCSSQKPEEAAETLRQLQVGAIKVLFVSPERFLNADFLSIFSHGTPSVSLVVVDEAHCVSEWSHNFRPSYMRLRASLLHEKLNCKCFLAMTATATTTTLHSIMSALEIPSTNLIQKAPLRRNLQLSVSLSGNRMKDLLSVIKSSPFSEAESIIVYCKFQLETDQVSRYLCDNNISAKSYHSGIPARERTRTQELFCSNKIRVVVATVAFGMGLDKRDVGAVINYSLPESLEEYVQEIGRAGRDGRLSYCHLFLDDITYYKLRSLSHSDGVDEYAVNKFLSEVFSGGISSRGSICSLVREPVSRKFDLREEVMLTILTHLELGEVQYLRLLPPLNVTCSLNFHKTTPGLLADKDAVVAAILKRSDTKQGQYVFDIPTLANSIRVTAVDLLNHFNSLQEKGEISFETKDPAYCYTIVELPSDFCSLSANLTKWLSEIETCKVRKLVAMYNAAVSAVDGCKMQGCSGTQHTICLQKKILDYFQEDDTSTVHDKMGQNSPFLRADMKVFLQSNSQAKFTPRAVARIMHGIGSPAYPSTIWSKTHFWGRYTNIDFKVVMNAAKAELMNYAGKEAL